MIERFNFYDVYGYLLPGLALLGILWFPLWLLAGRELPPAWWSAAVALVLGYLAGHVVARLGQNALPYSGVRGQQPSDGLLEMEDHRLPTLVKTQIIEAIERHFKMPLPANDPDERRRRTQAAFFFCRRALLREDAASYAEQFEGLYSLLRGCAAVAILSFSYYLGWATSDLLVTELFLNLSGYAVIPVLILILFLSERSWLLWVLAALLFPLGLYLGATLVPTRLPVVTSVLLLAIALGSLFLAIRFYLGYRYFAEQFAITVYRDFFVLDRMQWAQESH